MNYIVRHFTTVVELEMVCYYIIITLSTQLPRLLDTPRMFCQFILDRFTVLFHSKPKNVTTDLSGGEKNTREILCWNSLEANLGKGVIFNSYRLTNKGNFSPMGLVLMQSLRYGCFF